MKLLPEDSTTSDEGLLYWSHNKQGKLHIIPIGHVKDGVSYLTYYKYELPGNPSAVEQWQREPTSHAVVACLVLEEISPAMMQNGKFVPPRMGLKSPNVRALKISLGMLRALVASESYIPARDEASGLVVEVPVNNIMWVPDLELTHEGKYVTLDYAMREGKKLPSVRVSPDLLTLAAAEIVMLPEAIAHYAALDYELAQKKHPTAPSPVRNVPLEDDIPF